MKPRFDLRFWNGRAFSPESEQGNMIMALLLTLASGAGIFAANEFIQNQRQFLAENLMSEEINRAQGSALLQFQALINGGYIKKPAAKLPLGQCKAPGSGGGGNFTVGSARPSGARWAIASSGGVVSRVCILKKIGVRNLSVVSAALNGGSLSQNAGICDFAPEYKPPLGWMRTIVTIDSFTSPWAKLTVKSDGFFSKSSKRIVSEQKAAIEAEAGLPKVAGLRFWMPMAGFAGLRFDGHSMFMLFADGGLRWRSCKGVGGTICGASSGGPSRLNGGAGGNPGDAEGAVQWIVDYQEDGGVKPPSTMFTMWWGDNGIQYGNPRKTMNKNTSKFCLPGDWDDVEDVRILLSCPWSNYPGSVWRDQPAKRTMKPWFSRNALIGEEAGVKFSAISVDDSPQSYSGHAGLATTAHLKIDGEWFPPLPTSRLMGCNAKP